MQHMYMYGGDWGKLIHLTYIVVYLSMCLSEITDVLIRNTSHLQLNDSKAQKSVKMFS